MGLSDLYYKLEEKYYTSLDWFDSKGIHVFYKIDEWLQSKNIPSFPVVTIFNILLLAVIVLLILYFTGVFGTNYVNVTMQFVDVTNNASVSALPVSLSFDNGSQVGTTNDTGTLEVSLPKDALVQVTIESDKYMLDKTSFSATDGVPIKFELSDKSNLLGNKLLKLFSDLDNKVLFSGSVDVDLTCSGDANYIKKKTVVDGTLDLSDLPDDCGNLTVTSYDPEISKTIAVTKDSLELAIDAKQVTGTLRVIVQDDSNNVLQNMAVSVYSQDSVLKGSQTTAETGLTEFKLNLGNYYVSVSDSGSGEYSFISTKDLNDSSCNDQITEATPIVCTVTMQKLNIGKINLKILDISGKPVSTAIVEVYKGDLELFNDTLQQDSNGLFVRGVAEQGPYRIVVDAPQYMIYDNPSVMISDTPQSITLEPVKSSPVLSVYVTANDDVVANATVQLFKEGNLLLTKTTGADGIAFFDRLETGKVYNVKVVKGEYSTTSNTISLDARQQNKLEVKMVIGKGNVDVVVLNKNEEPVLASVELFNVYDDKSLGTANQTDSTGTAHFYGIGADKTVYAKIITDAGTSYSLSSDVIASQTITLNAYSIDDSTTLNMELVGVYNGDGSQISTLPYNVVPSGEYYAMFLLQVPKGKSFNSGNIFFVGDGKTQAESSILIKSTEVLNGQETKGLTYTAPLGYAEDMLNKTSDNGLWSSVNLSKINSGSSLVKVDFIVSGEPKNDLFKLGYRASLKSGSSIVRTPVDNILGQNESVSEKLGFYAETSGLSFKSGDAICSDIACVELTALDSTGYTTKLGQDAVLYSQFNTDTVLKFKIVSATKTALTNLKLNIESKNLGLNISNVSVNGKELTGKGKYTLNVDSFSSANGILGNIGFTTEKEGDTLLTITLSSDKEVLFSKEIKVSVNSPNNLIVEYLPTTIIPYVLNLGAVVVSDANEKMPISDILVNVYLNDNLVTSGKTDGDGTLPVQLDKPNAGDVLKIVATGPGYNSVTTTTKITENILVPNKPEIVINVDKTEKELVTTDISLATHLLSKLKIKKVSFSTNNFSEFIDVKTSILQNTEIDRNIDVNISAQLTDLGKSLLEPKSFNTNLELVVRSDELDRQWTVEIPIQIYIRMFDSIDTLNCLQLLGDQNGTSSFKIVNNCMYQNSPIQLYNPTIFVEWDGTPLGDYSYNNDKITEDGLLLNKELKPKTTTFSLAFTNSTSIASGQSKVNMTLKAYFPTETGLQELTASKEGVVTVSDLKKCLFIIDPNGNPLNADTVLMNPITLGVAQQTLGGGLLGGLYGAQLTASNGSALGSQYGGGATYYQAGAGGTTNNFDAVLHTTSAQDPSLLWSGLQSQATATPGYGTTASSSTTSTANNGFDSLIRTDSYNYNIEDNSNTILFDVYPYTQTPAMVGGLSTGLTQQQLMQQQLMYGGQQSLYGAGQYGAQQAGMLLPSINQITFWNKCNEPVDIEIRSVPQLFVSPNTISIPGNNAKSQVNIMSTSLPGNYQVTVLAGTQGNILPLMTIPVNVIDYASNTATDDCFKLSDEPVINMSDVWKRNKMIKVYNYCYSKGVIFDDATPIALHNLYSRQPVVAKAKVGDLNDLRIEQNTPYVQAVALGVPNVQSSATYGQYQELTVMLEKDPTIQRLATENLSRNNSAGDWVSTISSVRSSLADIYNNVEFPAIFVINARIGYGAAGIRKSVQRLVTVRDMWNLLGAVDLYENLIGGDKSCVPSDKLTDKDKNNKFTSWTPNIEVTNGEIYTLKCSDFKQSEIRVPSSDSFTLLKKPCFGKGDSVKFKDDKIKATDKINGTDIELEITPNFDSGNIYFTVKPKTSLPKGTSGTIEVPVNYTVQSYYHSDAGYDALNRKYTLKLKLDLDCTIDGSTATTPADTTKVLSKEDSWCVTNFGDNWYSLNTYGFGDYNNLSLGNMLAYNYPTSKATAKDCTKYFCDAEQLKLFLDGKFSGLGFTIATTPVVFKDKNLVTFVSPSTRGFDLLQLTPNDVLDPLSKFFLDRDLRTFVDTNSGLAEFKKLVANMPDLYLKVINFKCNSDANNNVAFEDSNNCYYNAKMLSEHVKAEQIMRSDLNKPYEIVFLVDSKTTPGLVLFNGSYSGKGTINKVYLKPDDYNRVFNTGFLSYNAELLQATKITKPGAYVAISLELGPSGKKLILYPGNYYLGSSEDTVKTLDKLFYNLPVDPSERPSYAGQYGLCISTGQLKVDDKTISSNSCGSTEFAKAKTEISTDNYLSIVGTNDLKNLIIKYPKCDTSGCEVTIKDNKKVTVPKEGYLLNAIFDKSNEYCYKEESNTINIKYSGVKN